MAYRTLHARSARSFPCAPRPENFGHCEHEVFRALRGWMDPSVPENYFQLRPEYTPGDLDFDPAGLKPEDPEEFKEMQTKELQHCRLAMLAAAGMIVQELQTGATLFYVSPLAPASAENILELKAKESIVRGQVGWSQQSSENSRPLTLCEAGPSAAADFTDVQSLPGIISPTGFFDPAGLSEGVSPSELKRYREAELTHGRVAMLASLGFLVGESGATPLFGGKIDGIAINQFWQVPKAFWQVPKASSRTTLHRGARSFPRAPQLDGANRSGELFPAPDAL